MPRHLTARSVPCHRTDGFSATRLEELCGRLTTPVRDGGSVTTVEGSFSGDPRSWLKRARDHNKGARSRPRDEESESGGSVGEEEGEEGAATPRSQPGSSGTRADCDTTPALKAQIIREPVFHGVANSWRDDRQIENEGT